MKQKYNALPEEEQDYWDGQVAKKVAEVKNDPKAPFKYVILHARGSEIVH